MINKITKGQSIKCIEENISLELKGKQLWGDLEISFEEYEILRDQIKKLLYCQDITLSYICKKYPCTLITFMIALVRYKYNYNFWGLMSEELSVPIYGAIETEIGTCARSMFERFGFDFSDVKDERRINLEPIFYEAGLPPESSLDDLFYVLNYDAHNIFDPHLVIDDLIEMRSYQIRKPLLKFLKRFKDDRALEFVLEVYDAMLCVDQRMGGDSRYISNYTEWKTRECSKEVITVRKKQEFQTKPYLSFENGKRGLCLVLPRTVMKNEWIEDAEWIIYGDDDFELHKKVVVFGDEGKRYVDSIIVPVCPSKQYVVRLIDNENIDDSFIVEWRVDGIKYNEVAFFNSNGRMINANYLPSPYAIMILGEGASIIDSKSIATSIQAYPTSSGHYSIVAIEPTGSEASLSYHANNNHYVLNIRPQIYMSFEGKTLFSMPADSDLKLYTDIPMLNVDIDEDAIVNNLELRIGQERLVIDSFFSKGHASISLKTWNKSIFQQYGTYSIRLYQCDHFLKQIEFILLPKIKTTYNSCLSWPINGTQKKHRQFKFEKNTSWEMEFSNCVVSNEDSCYIIDCQPNTDVISVGLHVFDRESSFSCNFELPVNPFELKICDNSGSTEDEETRNIRRIGLSEIQSNAYWLSVEFFGEFRYYSYTLKLHTTNGIEQTEKISLAQNGCGNFNISLFYDTLSNCPLPAQLELWCDEREDYAFTVLIITDTVQLKKRPSYSTKNHYVTMSVEDEGNDLTLTRFGLEKRECRLLFADSKLGKTKKGEAVRGYKCKEPLLDGLYHVEGSKIQSDFKFEDEGGVTLSNGTDTMYVTSRDRMAPIKNFTDWLDQLIRDILSCGITKDIALSTSYKWIGNLSALNSSLSTDDYEKLISLAFFVHTKCSNSKRSSILDCMRAVSTQILDEVSRLELIRILAKIDCPSEVFEICLKEYNLFLFLVGSPDAKTLAEELESQSIELSMLLRMGADDSIRNTLWREKYRELIGKEAIKSLLSVPNASDTSQVALAQKMFLREHPHSSVRINLTKEISGDMKPIQDMIKVTYNKIIFDISKKPDIGIYFDHIRYVDQYVNWYSLNHDENQNMIPETKTQMIKAVQNNCKRIMQSIYELKQNEELKSMVTRYDYALQSRYSEDPLNNISACIPARFFYLQGLAALLARLPEEYHEYRRAVRTGEDFMIQAMSIAPRIAKRDLIMASTYIYLIRKENKLCQ